MHGGGNRIYGRHMIVQGLFAECEVLDNYFQGHWGPTTRTRTCKLVLDDKDGLFSWTTILILISLYGLASVTQDAHPPTHPPTHRETVHIHVTERQQIKLNIMNISLVNRTVCSSM